MKAITKFQYLCIPMFRDNTPILSVVVYIIAETRAEADLLFNQHAHKFFNLDMRLSCHEVAFGYQQEKKDV